MHNTIRAYGLLAPALFSALLACDKKEQPPAPVPTQTAVATAAPAPTSSSTALAAGMDAGTISDAGGNAAYMLNCPTAATGAKTALKDIPDGIELTITGSNEDGTREIRDRVKKLIDTAKSQAAGQHNHGGGGRGRSGHCTVITHNTSVESLDVPGGAKVSVKAKQKDEVDWLRRETRERDQNAHAPGGGAMGKNHLAHCPSAVDGATTKVTENKEGVVLTVTSKNADAVKWIRERAKHQVEIAKKPDAPAVDHNSEGGGGGALGRCPVVVQGDTMVEAKDVEGGSEISVKAKKAGDVAGLQKETKERVASLSMTKLSGKDAPK